MTNPSAPALLQVFDRIAIINLPERGDRRRELRRELAALGTEVDGQRVRFIEAIRPAEAAGFPSIGAHGCFLSHLKTLRQARDEGVQRLLVLEDDVMFTAAMRAAGDLLETLKAPDWRIAYLGHQLPPLSGAQRWLECREPMQCLHAYALQAEVLPGLIEYLEACLQRAPGDPAGGPMHVDGAVSMWRLARPEQRTLRSSRSLAGQRSSRSDIIGPSWLDRLPLATPLRRLRNGWRRYTEPELG